MSDHKEIKTDKHAVNYHMDLGMRQLGLIVCFNLLILAHMYSSYSKNIIHQDSNLNFLKKKY